MTTTRTLGLVLLVVIGATVPLADAALGGSDDDCGWTLTTPEDRGCDGTPTPTGSSGDDETPTAGDGTGTPTLGDGDRTPTRGANDGTTTPGTGDDDSGETPTPGDSDVTPTPGSDGGTPTPTDDSGTLTPAPEDDVGTGTPTSGDRNGALTPTGENETLTPGGDDGGGTPTSGGGTETLTPSDGSETPTAGDGDGTLTPGDGTVTAAPEDGNGTPTSGDGDGTPTSGDGDGTPTSGDGDGTPTPGGDTGTPTPGDDNETQVVEGAPAIDVFAPDRTVEPGTQQRLTVQVVNSGTVEGGGADVPASAEQRVTTAQNVRVTLEAGDAPITVRSGTVPLGAVQSGSTASAGFDIAVDGDAEAGTYDVPVTVEYDYVASISGTERETATEAVALSAEIVVDEQGRFEIESVESDLQVGQRGPVTLTLSNVGEADLEEAEVLIRSRNRDLRVDTGGNTTRFVGDWEAGDEETVTFRATATNQSGPDSYGLAALVTYVDEDGNRRRSRLLTFGVTPGDEQSFSLDDLDGDLAVGEDGTVTGEVTNEGPSPVADAVVRLVDGDGDVVSRQDSVVLGDLDDGEDEDFEYPVRVPEDAEAGERQLRFVVDYVDTNGDPRVSTRLRGTVDVDDEDSFELDDVDSDVRVGEEGTVEVSLTNLRDEDLTEARVTLTSRNRNLRVDGDANASRFVGDWDEGDDETVSFQVRASNDSTVDEYPLTVRVRYTDSDGDARQSDPIRFGVTPNGEQTFAIRNVSATLRKDTDGEVNASLVNRGPASVSNAVVRLADGNGDVTARQQEVVIGNLTEDEQRGFSYPVRVAADAEPGPRQLQFVVVYRNEDGDRRRSERIDTRVVVGRERNQFRVLDVLSTVQVGEEGRVRVRLRNRVGDLTDARVSLTSRNEVLRVDGGENGSRFVGDWDRGENRTISFRVRAANDSVAEEYPLTLRVRYTDADGDPDQSDPIRIGITPDGEQSFAVSGVTGTLRVDADGRVRGTITNDGPRRVSNAVLRILPRSDQIQPTEAEFVVGRLRPGASRRFSFPVSVTDDAEPGRRQLNFRLVYENADGDRRRSDLLSAVVTVADELDRFAIVGRSSRVQVGDRGTLTLELENRGNETAGAARVELATDSGEILVGDERNSTRFVGRWAPGERRTVDFVVAASNGTEVQSYALRAAVAYVDTDGDSQRSGPLRFGLVPLPEQTFDLTNVSSTLRVDDSGEVRGTLVNEGPTNVTNAVLRLETESPTVQPQETEYAVDGLPDGSRVNVSFPIDITQSGEPGPRQFDYRVTYTDEDCDRRRSAVIPARVLVRAERDAFVVRPVAATVEVGKSGTVSLAVRNNRREPIRNINAKVFVDDPLSTDDTDAFVTKLEPGETTRLNFSVSAAGGTDPRTYPLQIDFQYDTADGDTTLSKTYQVGVTVVEPERRGLIDRLWPLDLSPVTLAPLLLAPLALLGWYLRENDWDVRALWDRWGD